MRLVFGTRQWQGARVWLQEQPVCESKAWVC